MEQSKLDRINFLAKKSRSQELSAEEKEEQKKLREEYVAAFKRSLVSQLENTYVVEKDGTKRKLGKKSDK